MTTTQGKNRAPKAISLVRTVLVKEAVPDYSGCRTLSTPEEVTDAWLALFGEASSLPKEQFVAFALNTKNHLLAAYVVSVGSLNASIVHPREMYREAVMLGAASVVAAHNHPSGDPTPSGADIQLTRRLVRAGDVLGIELLDHVVIGDDDAVSMRELGFL